MSGDTVHFDIVDKDGNMVSATPSGGWLHGSPVVPELGFPVGTRGQICWLEEGQPSSLAPGKRPRTTLTPTLAHRDGEPYMCWGSPGGDQQEQWITQMFLRHVHCGMNLQEAIDAPAWHSEHFPSSFWPRTARPGVLVLEGRVPSETVQELRKRGHEVEMNDDWSEGRLTAASREDPWRKAAANPRGMQGYAAGRDRDRDDAESRMTWSIIFRERDSGRIAIAVATKFFAVGARVPYILPRKGAVATQALLNPLYGPDGLQLIRDGVGAADVVRILTARDPGQAHRQLHVLGADGRFAAHTGAECVPWCGHWVGEDFSVAGNMLAGPQVVAETVRVMRERSRPRTAAPPDHAR